MSLQSFQQALVELTLAPWTARALRDGDARQLDDYDLTSRERERLWDIVRQPGISVHCTLSRGNRYEMVVGAFPMTCVLLRPVLRTLLNEIWQQHRPTDYQLACEQTVFAEFISRKITAGDLAIDYLGEIFSYEVACQDLLRQARTDPHCKAYAVVRFEHVPDDLFLPLSRLALPPAGLPCGTYAARVVLRDERFELELL